MNKTKVLSVLSAILFVAMSFLAVLPLQGAESDRSDWMSELNDSATLSSLSIPGTHDSGALYSIGDLLGKCQTLSIKNQLKIGVRFLDIRLQLVNDELKIVHSIIDQKTHFEDVLYDMVQFLVDNPTEFLIVSFKEDASPKGSLVGFTEKLESMLREYESTGIINYATSLPETVGEARGKLHIISRYYNSTVGVPCYNGWVDDDSFELGGLYIQDNYNVGSSEEKFIDITDAFTVAAEESRDLVINFASCYFSSGFPPIYAGLPAHDINHRLSESLPTSSSPIGVLLCDFITSELSDLIIRRNFQ